MSNFEEQLEAAMSLSRESYLECEAIQEAMRISEEEHRLDQEAIQEAIQEAMRISEEEHRLDQVHQTESEFEREINEAMRLSLEVEQPKNDCLINTFKQLYKIRFQRDFVGDVRNVLQYAAAQLFGTGDITADYELGVGQQLSLHAFELILTMFGMRVAYIRGNMIEKYLGTDEAEVMEEYGILHTIGNDFGVMGEHKYAGHYEPVRFQRNVAENVYITGSI